MSTRPAKRVMGQGTVYHRLDGRWSAQVSVEGRRRTVYAPSQAECVARLHRLQQEVAGGLPAVDQRTTVGEFLTRWLGTAEPRLRPSTAIRYRGIVAHQLVPHLGRVKLSKLQPSDVAAMLARLRQEGLSPRTCAHARSVLRNALSDAEKWGVISRNVARLADPPRVPRPTPKTLPPAEVKRVLEAFSGTALRNLVAVGLWTGMRQGEVLGLRWADIDSQGGQLTVGAALQRLSGESALVEPKSEHSRRTLRLSAPALEALQAERQSQLARRLAAGSRWKPTIADLVFTDRMGAPRVGTTVTKAFQQALRVAGLPPLRFHHLRHLHGALLLASGVDLATVSHLLGHSSVALTASTYAGVMPSLREDATDRLERLLR